MRLLASCLAAVVIAASAAPSRLHIDGAKFVDSKGQPFQWRGITAFRLVEMVAHGREKDAAAYLDWAASRQLTVVRVFTMAHHLFKLTPQEGTAALPRLLELAAARKLYVEAVGLVDTSEIPVDVEQHVKNLAAAAAKHSNALVEIANEPVHPTQRTEVHKPDRLRAIATLIPSSVPVSLGSVETGAGFAAGSYVTWHVPRNDHPAGWGHVLAIADGSRFADTWKKPIVSDEPIGAGPKFIAGRRDNDPARFRAAALVTRLAGLGATFHYEAGLQGEIPRGRELECFNAWNEAWRLLPRDVERRGTFGRAGEKGSVVRGYDADAAIAVYERQTEAEAFIAAIGVKGDVRLRLPAGWRTVRTERFPGVRLVTVRRSTS